ncbi:imidazole glycerol phosphate synthase [Sulfolobus acidocaldarius SUSAZ]|nr:imidazole glycerol phosphate synthase [Sulfolobus acidocaldarius SUSAZ]
MTSKRIIPCLDVKDGRVVKGVNFLNLVDKGDPVELAARYEEEGADEIVFLDITATIEGRKTMMNVVKDTASVISIPLTVGGGIRSLDDVSKILGNGADKVSINTAAVENRDLVSISSAEFGSQAIVVAIDVKRIGKDYYVFTRSGKYNTGINAINWAKDVEKLGAGEILLTSIDRDGTREGYDIEITELISKSVNIPIIASGGAGKIDDFLGILKVADAALAAGVFHDGVIRIMDLKKYLGKNGVEVRM